MLRYVVLIPTPHPDLSFSRRLGASKVGVADVLLRICPEANSQIGICIAPKNPQTLARIEPFAWSGASFSHRAVQDLRTEWDRHTRPSGIGTLARVG